MVRSSDKGQGEGELGCLRFTKSEGWGEGLRKPVTTKEVLQSDI